jgi:hypothetical protein
VVSNTALRFLPHLHLSRMPANARYYILTIPHEHFTPFLPQSVGWIKGQLERAESGFLHWQLVAGFSKSVRLAFVRKTFGPFHAEATRSDAAEQYVWKDLTSVPGTRFELGTKPLQRANTRDWESILDSAKRGSFEEIPADVYIRSYSAIKKIRSDCLEPCAIERRIRVFWGSTGTGKSRRAWQEAGLDAYPKDPRSKFWDGYREHNNVVIDEFRGGIDISHVLRWFDQYPVIIEIKGSSTVLKAQNIWITSNLHPNDWYPTLDSETKSALLRRLEVTHFNAPLGQ